MDLFDQVVEAGGVLLKVTSLDPRPDAPGEEARALVLTFDVGNVLVAPDDEGDGLRAHQAPGPTAELENASEEEPWWRFIGNPLTRARNVEQHSGVLGLWLQFRHPEDNPRQVCLTPRGERVRAELIA